MPLTDVKIRQTKATDKPIRLIDGSGLFVEVTVAGTKYFRYRYKINGKGNVFAIGRYPDISLQEARRARDEARELVKQGIHPVNVRRKEKAETIRRNTITFESIAREWLTTKESKCTPNYLKQVTQCLERNAFPIIGKLPIRDISPHAILSVLRDMEKRGAQTFALLLRTWISSIFKYAIVTLRADSDPSFVLQGAIQRPNTRHSTAMTIEELAEFKRRLSNYRGHYATIYAIRLLMYTFVRTVELIKATWDEVDLAAKEWRIQAGRMKMNRMHIVPLAQQVVDMLTELHTISGRGRYLFPHLSKRNKPMSSNAINMAIHYMGYEQYEWTGHDFRATASTHLHEMGFADHLIEMQLAHVEVNRTRAAYNHARYLTERADMMQQWCDWIDGI